ncbi:hypothetical protein V3C99_004568, partial [Haemonchus contortus]
FSAPYRSFPYFSYMLFYSLPQWQMPLLHTCGRKLSATIGVLPLNAVEQGTTTRPSSSITRTSFATFPWKATAKVCVVSSCPRVVRELMREEELSFYNLRHREEDL